MPSADRLLQQVLYRIFRINQRKSLPRAKISVEHLKEYFEHAKVVNITSPKIKAYIEERKKIKCKECGEKFETDSCCPSCGSDEIKSGATNATINRELSTLKRMLNLGAMQNPPRVNRTMMPYITMLKENNVRKGFFEHGDFLALQKALPPHLKGFTTFGYKVGWRHSEIAALSWKQVDLDNGIVRLEAGETKNDDARTVYLDEELKEIFQKQWDQRADRQKLLPYVLVNQEGTNGITRFDKAWKRACKDAKIGIRHFHDLRRTACRNMIRAGIPERVAMMVSGHKTRSVFDRYNIVNDADLKLAAQRQEIYIQSQMGKVSGKVYEFEKTMKK